MSETVLNELQLLTAMYDPRDIRFHDPEVLNLVENCIPISDSVSLTVRINEYLELDIRLPLGYPETERLSAHCRISSKNPGSCLDTRGVQQWESQLNSDLTQNYLLQVKGHEGKGDEDADNNPDILGVIQWCNENFDENRISSQIKGCQPEDSRKDTVQESKSSHSLCRIWIFSHHIYNTNKRKFLVNTANELDLCGFSHPGKPGFVCVEGDPESCDEYWSRVRQLTWQKISLIERQTFPPDEAIFGSQRFEELNCDKSSFIRFLEEKNASSVIKEYLGI